jgi:hypothetical protein
MTISDYQISSVIKTYVKNIKMRVRIMDPEVQQGSSEDAVAISDEGMKRMLFERIGEQVTERLRRHGQE